MIMEIFFPLSNTKCWVATGRQKVVHVKLIANFMLIILEVKGVYIAIQYELITQVSHA
jgi:hypothetical protein